MPFVFRFLPILLLFVGSQIYFPWKVWTFFRRVIFRRGPRVAIGITALAVYVLWFWLNLREDFRGPEPTHMTLRAALINAPFLWWIFSSTLAFPVALVVELVRWIGRWHSPVGDAPALPERRQFLEAAGTAAVAAPFVAGAYGLLWGRINLQVTNQKVPLARLPRAFHGFRIAQLSDIHVGPFMSEDQIRKYVRIANELKPDLIALTGDYVTWDGDTSPAVVRALSGLKARFGVYGCLGNHDAWAGAEDLLTELFAQCGIRILRQQNTAISLGADHFQLVGIDFTNSRRMSAGEGHMSSETLTGVEALMAPDTANILLSHNPESFDRAAALGVDLSLAGHTHGGQLALEFISPEIAPSRIVTPYVAGMFEHPGGKLYVNRGIGTIAAPMRVGAPPEITVFELERG